ncbi:MAG: 3-dehydroquinate synthase [Myxococcales bacterium FL481]|nr:MAG: 3-dehydroquinate synthase [Myxococcales bacterium FL481]
MEQHVELSLRYDVCFVDRVFESTRDVLINAVAAPGSGRRPKVLLCVDDGLARANPHVVPAAQAYLRRFSSRCQLVSPAPLTIPGGEAAKQGFTAIEPILRAVYERGLDRHDSVIAVGGGAVLDAVGFAAAVAHRGVRLVRVPTTVLSQNDAGVGVKNAINLYGSKNFVGTFATPTAVLVDTTLLHTLAVRDQRAGMAEAVKVAAIRDAEFFLWLEAQADSLRAFEPAAVARSIRDAAHLHLAHIRQSGDPFERGSARPLDFGHWAAHKLESMTDHELRHGEAVAIGMCIDTAYAVAVGHAPQHVAQRLVRLLERLGLPTGHPALARRGEDGRLTVLDGLEEFRQHLGGELSITLLSEVGVQVQVHAIDTTVMAQICEERADGCRAR